MAANSYAFHGLSQMEVLALPSLTLIYGNVWAQGDQLPEI